MEPKKLFEILMADYKSIRQERTYLLIMKYLGVIVLTIMQLILGCYENYFLTALLIIFLMTLFYKDSTLSRQLARISQAMADFTHSKKLKQYQEIKYYEIRNWKRFRYFNLFEFYFWIILSVAIAFYKIKYVC